MTPDQWIQAYLPLAREAFGRRRVASDWPELDALQRWVDQRDLDTEVRDAVSSLPALPGIPKAVHPTRLVLPLQLLQYLPEARDVLDAAAGITQEAVRQYLAPDVQQPQVSFLAPAMRDLDPAPAVVALAAELLAAEPFFPLGGGSTGGDEWQLQLDPRWVRQYRDIATASEMLQRQLAIAEAFQESQQAAVPQVRAMATVESVDPSGPDAYEYDVALSFAGENRSIVSAVAEGLKARGIRAFYDEDYQAAMWGEDLIEYFDSIYRQRSRFAIVFISADYAAKHWTRLERRSVLARGLSSGGPYVLPIRLDDSDLPGLNPTVGYLDARLVGVDGIVSAVSAKLSVAQPGELSSSLLGVPSTPDEIEIVRRLKPPGWEYLLFAGSLQHHRARLAERYRDYLLEYAPPSHTRLSDMEVLDFCSAQLDECAALIQSMARLMGPNPQDRAFGAPGHAGDADLVLQLAGRISEHYALLLDWVQRVRGTTTSERFRPVLERLADFGRQPIEEYHRFIETAVTEINKVPLFLATPDSEREAASLQIDLTFTAEVPDAVTDAFEAELERLRG